MKILIGTNNEAKVKKYGIILDELQIEYCTPKELNLKLEVEEIGKNSEENSKIKANAFYEASGKMPVIVDDCSMVIDGLEDNEQPGVFVRRYNGKRLSDEEWITKYSKIIKDLGGNSTGAFVIAISIVDENGQMHTHVTRHDRYFVSTPCGARTPGYPANSLIFDQETGKYLAEEYEGKRVYTGSKFERQDYEFIKSVLKK